MKEAWEEATALMGAANSILSTLVELVKTLKADMQDDYDQQKPMSRSRIRLLEDVAEVNDTALGKIILAEDTIRRQRSALFSQGLIWEGEE